MAAMAAAKAMGATGGRVVSYANSGDLPIGERDRVVGYGAVVIAAGMEPDEGGRARRRRPPGTSRRGDKKALLALARETISRFLTTQMVPLPRGFSPAAMEPRGVRHPQASTGICAAASAGWSRTGRSPPSSARWPSSPPSRIPASARSPWRRCRSWRSKSRSSRRCSRSPAPTRSWSAGMASCCRGESFGGLSPPGRPGTGLEAGRDAGATSA